jgi:hypothetical protein
MKSKKSLRQFQQELKDGVREQQNQEARAFKADKRKRGQAITEKSFEEFKAVVAPKVLESSISIRCGRSHLFSQILASQQKYIRHKLITHIPKFFAPVVVNAAALVTFTMTLRQASLPPTPLSSEVCFLSESSLAQTDPFGILPAAIGIVAMLNTEVRRQLSVMNADSQNAVGGTFSRMIDTLARTFSIAVIFFAMTNPVVCGFAA